jgi:uncharacterized protein
VSGLTDLDQLLREMAPVIDPGEWVFVSLNDKSIAASLNPICTFVEMEGLTAICRRDRALRANLPFEGVFSHIRLTVRSSLHAVGLIAAVADALGKAGIPCNVVSAFHHDHLFVPTGHAKEAQRLLQDLSERITL